MKRMQLAALALAALLLTTLALRPAISSPKPASAAPMALAANDLARVASGAFSVNRPLVGELAAMAQSTLTAQVDGEIAAIRVRPGMRVKHGELLASFATRELTQKLAAQEAQLAKSREQLAFQKQQLERNRDLLAQKFISQNAFDSAASQLAVQQAEVRANEAQLALVRQNLDHAQVRAPISGLVAERLVEPGQRVAVNSRLFTLVNLDRLELKLQVPAALIGLVVAGQTVRFRVDGLSADFVATIARIAPVADSARNFAVYAEVDNRQGRLRGGMFARAELALSKSGDSLSVPSSALRQEGAETVVWVVAGKQLARRTVRAGVSDKGMSQILQGLSAGEIVIVTPLQNPRAGQIVTLPAAF